MTLLAALAALTSADTVVLKDGSTLIGQIRRLSEGKLEVETGFAGTLQIDMAQVERLESDQQLNIGFKSGDRVRGVLSYGAMAAGGGSTTVNTALGALPVDVGQVETIWPDGERSPEQLAAEMQLANTVAELKKEVERTQAKWNLQVEFGANYADGNTELLNLRGRVAATRTSEKERLLLFLQGSYAEQDKIRNQSEILAGGEYRYNFTPRLFGYAETTFEYDEFENLALRATVSGGPGYYFWKRDDHWLSGQLGAGYQHETYLNDVTTDKGILNVGLDYFVQINKYLQFTSSNRYYPSFDGLNDYRLWLDQAIVVPISADELWKLKFGALFEYDSIPLPGFERLDHTYYANLVLDVK